jgi:diadenosine tetraphosphate (Ap4A) HIT family hydrolase
MALPPDTDCLVCRRHAGLEPLAGGIISADVLVVTSHAQPFGGAPDAYLGYVFVEPRRHVPGLGDLSAAGAQAVGLAASRAAAALRATEGADHVYAFVIGHHVPHLHVHVVARYPGAPREYWGARVDEWPGAPRGAEDRIAAVAERLRAYLASGPA